MAPKVAIRLSRFSTSALIGMSRLPVNRNSSTNMLTTMMSPAHGNRSVNVSFVSTNVAGVRKDDRDRVELSWFEIGPDDRGGRVRFRVRRQDAFVEQAELGVGERDREQDQDRGRHDTDDDGPAHHGGSDAVPNASPASAAAEAGQWVRLPDYRRGTRRDAEDRRALSGRPVPLPPRGSGHS